MSREKALKGIEKLVDIWYGQLNEEYRLDLYIASRNKFDSKKKYYMDKGFSEPLSERGALQQVYKEIYKFSNMNK